MANNTTRANFLLLITSIIWGFAFVAQRVGMDYIGPFLFNGIRFGLGGFSLLPFIYFNRKRKDKSIIEKSTNYSKLFIYGGIAGLFIFAGSTFQQFGLIYTTAGKAGFITGLYVVIVPIIGLFLGKSTNRNTWIGASLAIFGLYLLSVKTGLKIEKGDLLVFAGAFFWASHVQIIDMSGKFNSLEISVIQFFLCSILSLIFAFIFETINFQSIINAYIPIAYAGFFSVGIAYTFQVIAQKNAHPSNAAIILSLESVFAVIGGWLMLGELLSLRGMIGTGLMLLGMIISQLRQKTGIR